MTAQITLFVKVLLVSVSIYGKSLQRSEYGKKKAQCSKETSIAPMNNLRSCFYYSSLCLVIDVVCLHSGLDSGLEKALQHSSAAESKVHKKHRIGVRLADFWSKADVLE